MALEENGMGTTMLVQPTGGNGCFGGNWGGDGFWIILLFLLLGNNGWGGWGNGFGNGALASDAAVMYPWMNQSNQINNGFRDQMLGTQINGIQSSITTGFGDVQNALCGGFAGVNASINGAQNAIAQQLYTNQISDLERSFAAQTANTAGMTALQSQLASCCCDNRLASADLKYTIATENCADRSAISDGIRDLLAATQAQTQTILDKMCQDKIDSKNDTIAQLRSELMYARGQASQDVQTAAIRAGQIAEADAIYNRLATCPVPTYNVPNPNCCYNACGVNCGCGA